MERKAYMRGDFKVYIELFIPGIWPQIIITKQSISVDLEQFCQYAKTHSENHCFDNVSVT